MKISIVNDDMSGCSGHKIYVDNKSIQNVNAKGFKTREFSEDEIFHLIGEKNYAKFENGKYEFDIPKWKLDIVSGNGLKNATREQNIFSYQYQKITS